MAELENELTEAQAGEAKRTKVWQDQTRAVQEQATVLEEQLLEKEAELSSAITALQSIKVG